MSEELSKLGSQYDCLILPVLNESCALDSLLPTLSVFVLINGYYYFIGTDSIVHSLPVDIVKLLSCANYHILSYIGYQCIGQQ